MHVSANADPHCVKIETDPSLNNSKLLVITKEDQDLSCELFHRASLLSMIVNLLENDSCDSVYFDDDLSLGGATCKVVSCTHAESSYFSAILIFGRLFEIIFDHAKIINPFVCIAFKIRAILRRMLFGVIMALTI